MTLSKPFTDKVTAYAQRLSLQQLLVSVLVSFTLILCTLYGYLIYRAAHEVENQSARLYLYQLATEIERELALLEGQGLSPPQRWHFLNLQYQDAHLTLYTEQYRPLPKHLPTPQPDHYLRFGEDLHLLQRHVDGLPMTILFNENELTPIDSKRPLLFGGLFLIALVIALLAIYVATLIAKAIAQPVQVLANEVTQERPKLPLSSHERCDAIGILSRQLSISMAAERNKLENEKQFAHHVSHELRTPVAIIQGNIELIKSPQISPDIKQQAIARIESSSHYMTDLITTFLFLGKSDPHKHFTLIELTVLASEQRQALFERYPHQDLQMTIHGNGQLRSHRTMVRVLMATLLDNAVSHCGNSINMWLSDEGFRIENDLHLQSGAQPGFGYGHGITRRIAHALNGELSIHHGAHHYSIEVTLPEQLAVDNC